MLRDGKTGCRRRHQHRQAEVSEAEGAFSPLERGPRPFAPPGLSGSALQLFPGGRSLPAGPGFLLPSRPVLWALSSWFLLSLVWVLEEQPESAGLCSCYGAVGRAPPQPVLQAGRGVPLVLAPTGAPFVRISGATELPFSAVETRAVVSGCLLHSLAPSALDPPP